ncbi:MAG: hypothetical protein GY893_12790, partial [bacterium]|nr:hypothetical protein [bacterium]
FGEVHEDTGQWVPKKYEGTYAGQSAFLNYSDSSDFGTDSSGLGNDFTVTSIPAHQHKLDSPSNNFCTLNPMYRCSSSTDGDRVFKEGNLRATASATGWKNLATTQGIESGKWYWEVTCQGSYNWQLGIAKTSRITSSNIGLEETGTYCVYCSGAGTGGTFVNSTNTSNNNYIWAENDVIMCAYDDATGKFWLGKNGTWFTSGNPATGANADFTVVAADRGDVYPSFAYYASTDGMRFNFGADSSFQATKTAQGNQDGNDKGDFFYTPPSGFLALCTDNLPEPSILLPTDHFNAVLYTGDGTTNHAITGVGFQPDLVWYKQRSGTGHHNVYDSVRGVQKVIYPNLASAEATSTGTQDLYAFGADGFTVGSNFQTICNSSGETFASWNWKAGGTA